VDHDGTQGSFAPAVQGKIQEKSPAARS